ncbi:hypothetical protein A3A70_00740 [candidate division WWE3 bacterium RIFCSPLOWO2_01_FULL_42_11]|uniref:N-end rule aminoacyl transferase C-terminal domain-containing protein n=1 Tax=candidate division WWE3 bacterium RIFCSPLOWO2_01_FULL_42_11 TaxID=1802627 RepID=A0A1F4VPZ1_UNCKA|nr:MAG: hypothetical protein A3A70_00740 [candidate division WWE3 bacterium RIFCSPLOWO2_01_FULL_42_11]
MKSEYLAWNHLTLLDPTTDSINTSYNDGYLFTRVAKNHLIQTRSLRIDLQDFEFSSENRRILNKSEFIELRVENLPMNEEEYHWKIHKMGYQFYSEKIGEESFSANMIRNICLDSDRSNFNNLFIYHIGDDSVGYAITFNNGEFMHYAYPFYDFKRFPDIGMALMTKAVSWAHGKGKRYVYLGSVTRATDRYKLQFNNLKWFDGAKWNTDLGELKSLL